MRRTPALPLYYLRQTALGAALVTVGCSRPTVELDIPKVLEEGKRYCQREHPKEYQTCAVAYAKAVERMQEELRRRVRLSSPGGDWFGPALVGYMLGRDLGAVSGGGYRQPSPYVPPPTLRTPPKPKPTQTLRRGGFGSRAVGRFGWGG